MNEGEVKAQELEGVPMHELPSVLPDFCGKCKREKVEGKCPKCPKTNPNGANQFFLDPRQKLCWDNYVNPKSETFGNGLQSAVKAGYEPDYANQITTTEWFKEKVRRMNLLGKAEKVLDRHLELPEQYDNEGKLDSSIERIKLDAAKFVASTQGKNVGYSTRTELTGENGESLMVDKETKAKVDTLLNEYLSNKDTKRD